MIKQLITRYGLLLFLMAYIISPSWATNRKPLSIDTIKASIVATSLLALTPKKSFTKNTTTIRKSKGKIYTFYTDGTVDVKGAFGEDLGTHKTNNSYPKPYETVSFEKEGSKSGVFVGLALKGGCYLCGDNSCKDPRGCKHSDKNRELKEQDDSQGLGTHKTSKLSLPSYQKEIHKEYTEQSPSLDRLNLQNEGNHHAIDHSDKNRELKEQDDSQGLGTHKTSKLSLPSYQKEIHKEYTEQSPSLDRLNLQNEGNHHAIDHSDKNRELKEQDDSQGLGTHKTSKLSLPSYQKEIHKEYTEQSPSLDRLNLQNEGNHHAIDHSDKNRELKEQDDSQGLGTHKTSKLSLPSYQKEIHKEYTEQSPSLDRLNLQNEGNHHVIDHSNKNRELKEQDDSQGLGTHKTSKLSLPSYQKEIHKEYTEQSPSLDRLNLQNEDNHHVFNRKNNRYSSKNTAWQPTQKQPSVKFLEKVEQGLRKAHPNIMRARGKHCVILIGDTGVGKSTLINALYSGIENMKESEVAREDFFDKLIVKKLVPEKEIKDEQGNILFHVGAGLQSVTTYPEIAHQDNIAFCDCPGFGDTRGGIFDVVNCISMGELFMDAESVQLCYLMTEYSVMDLGGRKRHIKKLLETLSTVFHKKGKQEEPITHDNLQKLRLVITQPSGLTKKTALQYTLFDIFTEAFKNIDKKIIAEFLKKNLFFIDAKDRPNKFVEGETGDKVADLKQQLVAMYEDMLYHPSVFTHPMTTQAKQEIEIALQGMQKRALAIFKNNGTKEEIDKEILQPLKSLEKYQLLKPLVKNCETLVFEVVRCIENKGDLNQVIDKFEKSMESMRKSYEQQIESLKSEVKSLRNQMCYIL